METQNESSSSIGQLIELTTNVIELTKLVTQIRQDVNEIQKTIVIHENELNQRKTITNNYTDAVLSKIEILKNIITKNIGDYDTFISPHLIEVQSIEEQIKQTGKISDKQFKTLNEIYLKQKRI
jgi:hypothetical protein